MDEDDCDDEDGDDAHKDSPTSEPEFGTQIRNPEPDTRIQNPSSEPTFGPDTEPPHSEPGFGARMRGLQSAPNSNPGPGNPNPAARTRTRMWDPDVNAGHPCGCRASRQMRVPHSNEFGLGTRVPLPETKCSPGVPACMFGLQMQGRIQLCASHDAVVTLSSSSSSASSSLLSASSPS